VLVFALYVAYALTTGQLDPLGFAYYGIGVTSWRTQVLLALLVTLQVFCLVDAVALARRRRRGRFWAVLGMVVLVLPLSLVISIARVDLWRYDRHTASANVIAGALMGTLIGATALLRRWAWRFTTRERESHMTSLSA
jgi:drug/metabolite transporter superfamily protein YnfA